jgi:chorismate mutase / prephenate dehydrogenase
MMCLPPSLRPTLLSLHRHFHAGAEWCFQHENIHPLESTGFCASLQRPGRAARKSLVTPIAEQRMSSDGHDVSLEEIRHRINDIDDQLLALVAERKQLSGDVARAKRATGRATRDYEREREVILAARGKASELGVAPDLAEELMRLLIRSSLTTQEKLSVVAKGTGCGRRALVIGGAGKMGRWFAEFLSSQGFAVESADPLPGPPGIPHVTDWRETNLRQDYIICATPLAATDAILRDLALRRPPGVVLDVGSLKSPLRAGLMALRSHGLRVTSIHPMFGPETQLLSGRHVIFVDVGHAEALERARELFAPTMAEQVVMSLDDHDRLIAYVLGLSHALSIAFFTALAESGEAAARLVTLASTTFDAQLDVATHVAQDNPDLYFEIQSLNDYGAEPLEALVKAVDRIQTAILSQDRESFVGLIRRGRAYLEGGRGLVERRA